MLRLLVEGVKGTGLKDNGEKGEVVVEINSSYMNEKSITINAFDGQGETYKKREEPKIVIRNVNKTYEFESFEDLIKQLEK